MKIAILLTSLYTIPEITRELIHAPHELAFDLTSELIRRGHQVTVFTCSRQATKARLINPDLHVFYDQLRASKVSALEFSQKFKSTWQTYEQLADSELTARAMSQAQRGQFDVLHHFMTNGSAMYSSRLIKTPSVFTIHDPLDLTLPLKQLLDFNRRNNFVSISKNQRRANHRLHFVANVYNGINLHKFHFNKSGGENLIHFGRLLPKKGVHLALAAAKKAGHKISLAGNSYDRNLPQSYFCKKILPYLGKSASYVGYIGDPRKRSSFLGHAKAFLFPCSWEEPFGLAVIEALACGTPVIAFGRGAIPEIMISGKTGYIVKNVPEMVRAIKKIDRIDRSYCRRHVEKYFSTQRMSGNYEKVYRRLADVNSTSDGV